MTNGPKCLNFVQKPQCTFWEHFPEGLPGENAKTCPYCSKDSITERPPQISKCEIPSHGSMVSQPEIFLKTVAGSAPKERTLLLESIPTISQTLPPQDEAMPRQAEKKQSVSEDSDPTALSPLGEGILTQAEKKQSVSEESDPTALSPLGEGILTQAEKKQSVSEDSDPTASSPLGEGILTQAEKKQSVLKNLIKQHYLHLVREY